MTNVTSGIDPLVHNAGAIGRWRHNRGFRPWLNCAAAARLITIAAVAFHLAAPLSFAADPALELRILPPAIVLTGPHASQQLVVEIRRAGQFAGDVTAKAEFVSDNPSVAKVSAEGVLTPVGDGTATIRAEVNGQVVETEVTVKSAQTVEPWSFRHDVQTVLTKSGCNMGACHGAQAGKKGFKLALRGYDHQMDFNTLTRQSKGRRVSLADPARSLNSAQSDGGDFAWRRHPLRRRQPRIQDRFGMDRRRGAGAARCRPDGDRPRDFSPAGDARCGPVAADSRAGHI